MKRTRAQKRGKAEEMRQFLTFWVGGGLGGWGGRGGQAEGEAVKKRVRRLGKHRDKRGSVVVC